LSRRAPGVPREVGASARIRAPWERLHHDFSRVRHGPDGRSPG